MHLGPEMRISPEGEFCTFSTYGTSPENPSRTRLAFTRFPIPPATPGKTHDADIWICGPDGERPRRLTGVRRIDPHNGARVDWIDDETVLYFDDFHAKVRRLDGALVAARPGYPGEAASGHRVLVFQPDLESEDEGLQVLDLDAGTCQTVLRRSDLYRLGPGRLTHPRFSPDGMRIGFCLGEQFFSVHAEGGEARHFGSAPMHWLWHDTGSVVGHTSSWGPGIQYGLDGTMVETVSGFGNHLAVAPGGTLFASDTDYHSCPVVLRLYSRGASEGVEVFSSPHADLIWKTTQAHTNPSFARDGSRIYYTRPTGPDRVGAFFREILDAPGSPTG